LPFLDGEACIDVSALALAVDMSTRSQDKVLASEAYQLGDPKASLDGEEQ
jgi:hypothetical protein